MPRTTIIYTRVCAARFEEQMFPSLMAAVDAACEDLGSETAMPMGVAVSGREVYAMTDLCEIYDDWQAWRSGRGPHPAESMMAL